MLIKQTHIEIFGEYDSFKVNKLLSENLSYNFPKDFYSKLGGYYVNWIIGTGKVSSDLVIKKLFDNGAIIDAPDIAGVIPLANAVLMQNSDFLDLMIKDNYLYPENKINLEKYMYCIGNRFQVNNPPS
jgi:hypothetical protein